MVDPSLDEEEVADARLTVVCDENGDIRAMQKGMNGSFTIDEIKYIVETLKKNNNASPNNPDLPIDL